MKYLCYSIKRQYLLLICATITVSSMEVSCKCEVQWSLYIAAFTTVVVLEVAGRDDIAEIIIGEPASVGQDSLIQLRGLQGTATSVLKSATDAPNKHFLMSKVCQSF